MRLVIAAAVSALLFSACGAASPGSLAPSAAATLQPASATPMPTSAAAPTSTVEPAATQESVTAAPSVAVVDLSDLDVCALLAESDVQALTGTSLDFDDQATDGRCFWGATVPGEPQYVELSVFARPTGLTGYTFNPGNGCEVAPVTGVGAEAIGAICDNPQHKVYVLAADSGVAVQVLVNEPTGSLDPETLATTAAAALEEVTAPST